MVSLGVTVLLVVFFLVYGVASVVVDLMLTIRFMRRRRAGR